MRGIKPLYKYVKGRLARRPTKSTTFYPNRLDTTPCSYAHPHKPSPTFPVDLTQASLALLAPDSTNPAPMSSLDVSLKIRVRHATVRAGGGFKALPKVDLRTRLSNRFSPWWCRALTSGTKSTGLCGSKACLISALGSQQRQDSITEKLYLVGSLHGTSGFLNVGSAAQALASSFTRLATSASFSVILVRLSRPRFPDDSRAR